MYFSDMQEVEREDEITVRINSYVFDVTCMDFHACYMYSVCVWDCMQHAYYGQIKIKCDQQIMLLWQLG